MFAQLTRFSLPAAVLGVLAPALLAIDPPSSGKIDYTRDIRPILSDNCYHCHGPDAEHREKKLRLDTKAGLFDKADDVIPFVPGKLDQSEGWLRILSTDKDEQMPPPKSHKKLTPAQIELVKRWIEQGAPYQEHWAFQALKTPELPQLANDWWAHVPIDRFIAADLEKNKLTPSPEGTKEILLRRVTFDLTGLPPTPAETDAFLSDTSPEAYEHVVDRLLASPRYGEHMAARWLDLARYADSNGFQSDTHREMWHWRDWVIKAFNDNMPFDRFTIEQLAGDLLPNATRDQIVATGFHRNTMTNTEGGTDDEEWRIAAVKDRTAVTMQAWMGLTMGCCECHSHKYDPITQREYYSMFAFFNETEDNDQANESPTMPVPTA